MNRTHSNTHLPRKLYTAAQMRILDAMLIEGTPISVLKLMQRAASVVLDVTLQRWPQLRQLIIFVGTGNNAGDGYCIAMLAAAQGIKVQVLECGDVGRLSCDGAAARAEAIVNGVTCQQCDALLDLTSAQFGRETVLVDALLGIGYKAPLRRAYGPIIDWINGAGLPIVSVDIPSGLNCDTGHVAEVAVCATMTVCLVALKQGLFTGNGPAQVGDIVFHDLGIAEAIQAREAALDPSSTRIDINDVSSKLKPRRLDAHKGDCGNVLVLGGDVGYGGAALMAAEAASRIGAGTVCLVTRSPHVSACLARRPEIMVRGIDEPDGVGAEELFALLHRASVIVIGPGLGSSNWSQTLLRQALEFAGSHLPIVLDADALNLLAKSAVQKENALAGQASALGLQSPFWVLTPHPGEAARMLRLTVKQIQENRFAAVRSLQAKFGGAVLLKGAGSLLCCPDETIDLHPECAHVEVCTEGNPGMASGGMGDVLSGMLGGLIAQGLSVSDALRCAVCIHGEAADLATVDEGERGLLASDLFKFIRRLANNL